MWFNSSNSLHLRQLYLQVFNMRCKTAIGLCAFIVLVHLSLLMVLHGETLGDLKAEMKMRIYRPDTSRSKRDTDSEVAESSKSDGGQVGGRKILQNDLSQVELVTVSPGAQCRTGHVQGLRPVCSFGCLRRLYVGNPSFYPPRDEVVPTGVRQDIVSMGGKLHNIHISLVSHITDMQWMNGIYGTVGEIGAYEGQMTKVLSYNIDRAAGERLFVSDHFMGPATSRPHDPRQEVFVQNMKDVDFHVDSDNENNKLFLHVGQPSEVTGELLQELDLPQFRLLSIDGEQDAMSILMAVERASCMLRDGGVMVIGGVSQFNSQTVAALKHYFRIHGTGAFQPFVVARNKVYLTTTNWKDRVLRHFANDERLSLIFNLQEVTTNTFGSEMAFFTQKKTR